MVSSVATPRYFVPTPPVSLSLGRAGLSSARRRTDAVSGEFGLARSHADDMAIPLVIPRAGQAVRRHPIRQSVLVCQLLVAGMLIGAFGGCATWHSDADLSKVTRGLPPPKKPPGGAVLDVAFVSIRPSAISPASASTPKPKPNRKSGRPAKSDVDDSADTASSETSSPDSSPDVLADTSPDRSDSKDPASSSDPIAAPVDIWRLLDETVVVPEVRATLRRNGIRFGKVQNVGDFHHQLQLIRQTPSPTSEVLEIADVQSDLSHQARRITCRIGKRYELPVRQPATQDQVVLIARGDSTVGQTLSHSQPLFALRASAADSRSVTLSLRPEIQHGAMRQTWVGSDAALRIENRRDAWVLEDLATEITLEKGGILVVGGIDPAFGLGKHMFTGTTAEGDTDQVLMVIRVVELPELLAP